MSKTKTKLFNAGVKLSKLNLEYDIAAELLDAMTDHQWAIAEKIAKAECKIERLIKQSMKESKDASQ